MHTIDIFSNQEYPGTWCTYTIFWNIFSVAGVRYANLKNANYFLNIWMLLTFALSIMDLCLGIAFGIDYDTLRVNNTIIYNKFSRAFIMRWTRVEAQQRAAYRNSSISFLHTFEPTTSTRRTELRSTTLAAPIDPSISFFRQNRWPALWWASLSVATRFGWWMSCFVFISLHKPSK